MISLIRLFSIFQVSECTKGMQNNEFIYKYTCPSFLFGTFTIEYFKRTTFCKSDLD